MRALGMDDTSFEKKLQQIKKPEVDMPETQDEIRERVLNIRKTALIGPVIIVLFTIFAAGESPLIFFNLPSLLWSLGIPLFLVSATYGFGGIKTVFAASFNTNVSGEIRDEYISIFRDFKSYLIVSGWTGFMVGLILMAEPVTQMENMTETLMIGGSVALLTVFYGYMIAYLYCYPILRRIENNPE